MLVDIGSTACSEMALSWHYLLFCNDQCFILVTATQPPQSISDLAETRPFRVSRNTPTVHLFLYLLLSQLRTLPLSNNLNSSKAGLELSLFTKGRIIREAKNG